MPGQICSRVARFLIALAILFSATMVQAADVGTISVGGGIESLSALSSTSATSALLKTKDGRYLDVRSVRGEIVLSPAQVPPAPASRTGDMLPDGVVSSGTRNIERAWLTGPTDRYGHGVLGDAIEASGITARLKGGRTAHFQLPRDSVFEDRLTRFADIDRDGRDEILVVRSYLTRGAALTALTVSGDRLVIAGEAKPIGRANRWLNPIGAADFDGDGNIETAVVITPHIGGALTLYRLVGGEMIKVQAAQGFSNHAIGSRELGQSAIFDANRDGIVDIAVPDARRRAIRIVTFANGRFSEIDHLHIPGKLSTALIAVDLDGDNQKELLFGAGKNQLVITNF